MEKADSDSAKSHAGEEERTIGNVGNKHETDTYNALPDPDAGLSDEERAAIVRLTHLSISKQTSDSTHRTRSFFDASTSS